MQGKVLLIDDDVDLVEINRTALERAGYQVDVAYNGREGLAKALRQLPDVIVLDVVMDKVGEGFDVVSRLKLDPRTEDIPIILLTSLNRLLRPLPFGVHPEWLPVYALLDKPVSPDRLVLEVERALAGKSDTAQNTG